MKKYMLQSSVYFVTVVSDDGEENAIKTHNSLVRDIADNMENLYPNIKLEVSRHPMVTEMPEETNRCQKK